MKRQELERGFIAYTGVVWSDSQVRQYNTLQRRINKFIEAGLTVPENLLNDSHKLMVMFSAKV